ncbi:MAG: cobalamin biosynthesis protein, partial [Nitrospinota bacterium]
RAGEPVLLLDESLLLEGHPDLVPPGCSRAGEQGAPSGPPSACLQLSLEDPPPASPLPAERTALLRPRLLVVGMGCNKGTPEEEVAAVVRDTLREQRLAFASVRNLATVEMKKDEPGLLAFCRAHGFELAVYTREEANSVPIPSPSEVVFKHTGVWGVAEPAALLSARGGRLILEKQKRGNCTIALAVAPLA